MNCLQADKMSVWAYLDSLLKHQNLKLCQQKQITIVHWICTYKKFIRINLLSALLEIFGKVSQSVN